MHLCRMQVSSYMRAVLRTIAQCHSQRILHRDIKPGNFMLLSDSPKAPLKAIGEASLHMQQEHVSTWHARSRSASGEPEGPIPVAPCCATYCGALHQ